MLFSYEGERITRVNSGGGALRESGYSERELLSDVFIFEASDKNE